MTGAEVVPAAVEAAAEPGVVTVGILQSLGLSVADPEARALVTLCSLYRLDPLAGHVQVIETRQGDAKVRRVYVTVHGYREIAEQSGELLGMTETETYEGDTGFRVRVRVDHAVKAGRATFEFAGGCGRGEPQSRAGKGLAMARTRAVRQALRWAFPLKMHYSAAQYVADADDGDDGDAAYELYESPIDLGNAPEAPTPEPVRAPEPAHDRHDAARAALYTLGAREQAAFLNRHGLPNARVLTPDAIAELLGAER